jgi:hypothetical protein
VSWSGRNRQKSSCGILDDGFDDLVVGYQLRSGRWAFHWHQESAEYRWSAYCLGGRYLVYTNLLLLPLSRTFDAIPTLDHIRLKSEWPIPAMELQEKAARIAQDRAYLVPPP